MAGRAGPEKLLRPPHNKPDGASTDGCEIVLHHSIGHGLSLPSEMCRSTTKIPTRAKVFEDSEDLERILKDSTVFF